MAIPVGRRRLKLALAGSDQDTHDDVGDDDLECFIKLTKAFADYKTADEEEKDLEEKKLLQELHEWYG
jgi:hypothetical protein